MSRIYDLLDKFASGTCSREEFEELMQLLQANENEEAIRNYMRKLYLTLDSGIISDLHIDGQGDIFQSGEPVLMPAARPVFLKRMLIAACTLAVLCMAGLWHYDKPVKKPDTAKTVSRIYTPAGSKTSIALPDGTEVWLNSLSSLTYTTAEFNSGRREVCLIGEAMFRVKHDSLHPFVVHTKNFDVKDLGTVFNISAYPEDKSAQASLISGSIEITTKGGHCKRVTLAPNQRIIVQNDSKGTIAIARSDKKRIDPIEPTIKPITFNLQARVVPDTAWMANKLIFTDEYFCDLALQMQRRYNVTIFFRSSKAKYFKFTGRFEDEDVEDALQELQAIAPFGYKRSDNEIDIQ